MTKQRVLVFDIENSPLIAYTWGRYDVNIAINQIKHDQYVIAWAAKWLGEPPSKIIYQDGRTARPGDDMRLLMGIWKLLDEADIVITQNGKAFDSKVLNARFIMHGMKPPSPYRHLDTLQIARSAAKFTSNSLEYLADKLCTKYKKLSHSKFPGMELWKECLAGNVAAWNEMKRYNIHDVLSTEELYMKLRAWAPQNAPAVYAVDNLDRQCASCGASALHRHGYERLKTGLYLKLQCDRCGKWKQGVKVKGAI